MVHLSSEIRSVQFLGIEMEKENNHSLAIDPFIGDIQRKAVRHANSHFTRLRAQGGPFFHYKDST